MPVHNDPINVVITLNPVVFPWVLKEIFYSDHNLRSCKIAYIAFSSKRNLYRERARNGALVNVL